jgi:hypothetical protein
MTDGSLAQIEGRGTLINQAAADLLGQIGVELTEARKQTLLAGNSLVARSEVGIARCITAQAGGDEVEALFNIAQAITFNPSSPEALSRLNTLTSSISGGTISQRIVSDIEALDRWLEVFKETARFYNDYPPFEISFDPNLVQIGETDWVRRTTYTHSYYSYESIDASTLYYYIKARSHSYSSENGYKESGWSSPTSVNIR